MRENKVAPELLAFKGRFIWGLNIDRCYGCVSVEKETIWQTRSVGSYLRSKVLEVIECSY